MPRSLREQNVPDFSLEDSFGGVPVCGLDEVGRGPLAGSVVAACVYIPPEKRVLEFVSAIRDSKKLSATKLAILDQEIKTHFEFGIAEVSPEEIDKINILQASLKAMEQAYTTMGGNVAQALVDGNRCPKRLPCPALPVVKGDSRSISIAAASIIAKVHRDKMMSELAKNFPHYGWERNAGYPTAEHLAGIKTHGITKHHRKTFGPVKSALSR